MFLFHRSPENRRRHRLLKRRRWAYLLLEDVTQRRLLHDNLRIVAKAGQHAHDDKPLWEHWTTSELGFFACRVLLTEEHLWKHLDESLQELERQGFTIAAFPDEARPLEATCKDIELLLALEEALMTRKETPADERRLAAIQERNRRRNA